MPTTDFFSLIAGAADICRSPLRHGVIGGMENSDDYCVRLEVRDAEGVRLPAEDLELEMYRSAGQINLTLAWATFPDRPMLWHGSHAVWMDGATGLRCERPEEGSPIEALGRRLRALLIQG
ncbi:hypothetical protein KBY49_03115 [Cyanobium sp. WAJ14-Wanaka]|nr:hypothetical protein [Cyanobium sp. WAJ14-Wanaka]